MSAASDLANTLSQALLTGADFSLTFPDFSGDEFQIPEEDPASPLYAALQRISNADLTEGDNSTTGSGVFDVLMKGFKAHLRGEYDAGRITGQEYTKAYIAFTESAMSTGVQFLLGRDTAYWQAINAQLQAQIAKIGVVTTRVQLESEKTKLQLLRLEALNASVQYALNKLRLANESVSFDTNIFNLEEMLPQQKTLLISQVDRAAAELIGVGKQNDILQGEVARLPNQALLLEGQVDQIQKQAENLGKQGILLDDEHALHSLKTELLVNQVANQEAQTDYTLKQTESVQLEIDLFPIKEKLLGEQVETARAQTMDTRTDGVTSIAGSVGKQKSLYDQQIISYQRDAENKAAKIFTEAWTVMKTIDEGLSPPTGFSNANLDEVLTTIKTNNDL